jgi:signal transduction histidine kinase
LEVGRRTITSREIFPALTDISSNIGILIDEKDQLRDTSVLSLGALRQILPEWGGVQIRYRGFRVYPYGDDDWLDIDRDRGLRKTGAPKGELYAFAETLKGVDPGRALLSLSSMRSYVGNVEIGLEAKGFEMKSNREGFIHSPAIEELKKFVRFAIDWATIYHEYYIRTKGKENTETARQYFEEVLKEKVEPGEIVKSAVTYLQKETKNIASLLPAKERKSFEQSFYRATDAILKHEKSNQQELHHLRLIASTSTLLLIFSHEVKSLLGMLENIHSGLEIMENKLTGKDRQFAKKIIEDIVDSKTRFDELLDMTSLIGVDSKHAKPVKLVLLERIEKAEKAFNLIIDSYSIKINHDQIPKNIAIDSILEAELYAILLNVLSNSIKSVIAAGKEKKIEITAVREHGKTVIRIKDTGLGIDESHFEDVFVPFIADPDGKLYKNLENKLNPEDKYIVGTGSGLGLSIVKEIVQVRNGSISFRNPTGNWKAELEIILP